MGCCISSTTDVIDPTTGKVVKEKKTLGGSYPGNRRPQHAPYVPPATDFDKNGIAVSHFVAVGGGNALSLVQKDSATKPQSGGLPASTTAPQYIQVTLPDGVSPGQSIHVQAPDGRVNAIVIPEGFGPGSTFTVEFDNDPKQQQENPPQVDAHLATEPEIDLGGGGMNEPTTAPTVTAIPIGDPFAFTSSEPTTTHPQPVKTLS